MIEESSARPIETKVMAVIPFTNADALVVAWPIAYSTDSAFDMCSGSFDSRSSVS